MERIIFVRPEAAGWAVVPGEGVAVATFRSPADAIVFGRDYAQRFRARLMILAPDGSEHYSESYAAAADLKTH